MKEFSWYLPNGSGGMAAWAKTSKINRELDQWHKSHSIERFCKTSIYSENGLRYLKQQFNDADAVLFALTWDQDNSAVRYDYCRDIITNQQDPT